MRFAAVVLVVGPMLGLASRAAAQAQAAAQSQAGARPQAAPAAASAQASPPLPRRMSDEAELAQVIGLFEAGKYVECADQLAMLLSRDAREPLRNPDVVQNARIYHAACLIGSDRQDQADAPLRAAILANPQMKPPDRLVFPLPVVERFLRVRETLYDEIRRSEQGRVERAKREADERARREALKDARVLELEALASQEVLLVRNRRWIALIPFGVGQFQNGNTELGWVFLASEVALGATALTALAMQTHFTLEAHRLQNPSNNAVLQTWNTLLDVSAWGFLGVAALGIGEAQLSFVPEFREVRSRPIPPKLRRREGQAGNLGSVRVLPNVRAGDGGVLLGVSGVF